MDRAGSIRADEFLELAADGSQVRPGLRRADMIFLPDQAHGFLFGGLFQDEVCHQGGSRVQVQDTVGVDDQRAVTVRVEPQVDAALFLGCFTAVVIHAGIEDCSSLRFSIVSHFQDPFSTCKSISNLSI